MSRNPLFLAGAAALLLALGAGSAVADVYNSTDTPKRVPATGDSGPMTPSVIVVPAGDCDSISDLNVSVRINHTWVGDLTAYLTGPDGRRITLWSQVGNDTDDIDVTLDDEASANMSSPIGTFRCQGQTVTLCIWDGMSASGNWTLDVTDGFGGDFGQLLAWSIDVKCGRRSDGCGPEPKPGRGGGSFANNGRGNGDDLRPPGQNPPHAPKN